MSDLLRRHGGLLDLVAVVLLAVLAGVALLAFGPPDAVRWLLGGLLLLFLPGYAVVAALFPEQPTGASREQSNDLREGTPGWTVRFALSVVLSGILVAVIGVALSPVAGIRLGPAVIAVVGVTLLGVGVATLRRLRLPQRFRATPFTGRTVGSFSAGSRRQNLTLAIAVLALLGSVAFVGAAPTQGEPFTESYLLTEDADGDLVADDYPTTFVAGEGQPLYLGLENNEHRTVSYEVAVVVQEVGANGTVLDQRRIDRFGVDLAHGESTVLERDIAPTTVGDGLRLQFQVYKDAAPDDAASPDQTLQIWIDTVDEAAE